MAGRLIALDKSWEEAPAPPPPAATRLQALDASQWQEVPPGPAPDAEGPGALEAGLRGLKQGATFGFGDEISGALESAFTDKTYAQARDEARAADKAAKEAHPWVYGAGEVGGGLATALVPIGGAVRGATLGARLAGHAIRGAGAGILSGAGESEATDVGGVVQDAAKSGLVGAGVGAVLGTAGEKLFRGAPGRADERLIHDITGGRATTAGKKIYAAKDVALDTAKKFGIDKLGGDAAAISETAEAARKEVGGKIGQAFEDADRTFLGVRADEVASALQATAKRYSSPVDAPIRREIDSLVDQVKQQWGKGARARVPLAQVNEMATKLENVGFASANVTPAAGAQLKRDLARNVNDVLKKRMDEIGEFAGHVKSAPALATGSEPFAQSVSAADGLKRLGELNKDYRGLKLIGRMAKERAALPPSSQAAGGLRNAMGKAVDMGALATSIATANPLPYLATKAGVPLAKAGVKAGDKLLANIANAAATGKTTARLVQQAIEAGVPRGAIAAALTPSGVLGTGEAPAE